MTNADNLVLAADFGTSSLKLGLFDDRYSLLYPAPVAYTYKTLSHHPGWAEQNPEEWWIVFKKAVRDTLGKYEIEASDIACVSVGAHMGLVCLSKKGEPLRPAILFFDQRSTEQCKKIESVLTEEDLINICGNRIAPVQTATQMMWIRDNEPDVFAKTYKFLMPTGFIGYSLTGEYSYDWTHTSWTLLFDIYKREWSEEMIDLLEIPHHKLPPSMPSWEILGCVTSKAAEETGLKAGTPVMVGGSDTPLAALAEDVVNANQTLFTAGSVSSILACLDKPNFSLKLLNRCHVVPDRWLTQGAMNVHGSAIRWFLEEFCEAFKTGGGVKDVNPYRSIDRDVARSPVGAKNLILLPYLSGERAPIWDPYARGVLFGLSFAHKRADVARAIYEGTSYAARHNLEVMSELGLKIRELKISGQGAKSRVWNQIRADVLGKKITVSSNVDASLIGSAKLACFGMGWVKEFSDLQSEGREETFFPRRPHTDRYLKLFKIYKRLYMNLQDLFKDLQRV